MGRSDGLDMFKESGIPVVEMPPIPRAPFETDEDYLRAIRTSKAPHSGDPGSDVFIPEKLLIPAFIALFANHHAVGMGVLHDTTEPMTDNMAALYLDELINGTRDEVFIDYVEGRPLKLKPLKRVEGGFEFFSDLYNRDRPTLTAEQVIYQLVEVTRGI